MNDDLYTVSTPSDVHCNYCDAVNRNVDIYDDTRTGDWAYLFECRACERINDEHGNNYERGSTRAAFLVLLAGLALATAGWWLPSPWLQFTVISGLFVALIILTIAASEWLTRNGITE